MTAWPKQPSLMKRLSKRYVPYLIDTFGFPRSIRNYINYVLQQIYL